MSNLIERKREDIISEESIGKKLWREKIGNAGRFLQRIKMVAYIDMTMI